MSDSAEKSVTGKQTTTYPISQKIHISYSAFEDRLIVKALRMGTSTATLLLTRRMTILVLQQLLDRLAALSELGKTPSEYWHDVLQMEHQQAMTTKLTNDNAAAQESANLKNTGDALDTPADAGPSEHSTEKSPLFLATELTIQVRDKQLMLAFAGLPMPESMTEAHSHNPVLAIPLQLEHVHQLIELLINRAAHAQWHLPLELPWLRADSATAPAGTRRDN